MAQVVLGNTSAIDNGTPLPGNKETTVHLPDNQNRQEALRSLFHTDGLWSLHSTAARPDWVESDDPELALAIHYVTGCPVGRPVHWVVS